LDRLAVLLQKQADLQMHMKDGDPRLLEGEARTTFLQWNAFALTDELHEAMQEVGWKPWATSNHVNESAFLDERVDAFHFFMNMLLAGTVYTDVDSLSAAFFARYEAKHAKNIQRQQEGYDGVSDKCSECKRELVEGRCPIHG